MKHFILLCTTVIMITACTKTTSKVNEDPQSNDVQLLNSLLEENKSPANEFNVNPSIGGIFTTLKGSRIYVKPNAFKRTDGSLPTGNVKLHVRDILDASDMLLNDRPSTTSYNAQLISFCELFLSAKEGNTSLIVNPTVSNAVVAKVPLPENFSDTVGVPIWYGDTTISSELTGLDEEAHDVTLTKPRKLYRGVDWDEAWGRNAQIIAAANSAQKDTITYTIENFDVWLNCDQLNFDGRPRTKLFCYFNTNFNERDTIDNTLTPLSNVFYKPQGQNILVKCSNPIITGVANKHGYYTNENLSPIGLDAKFIAFSVINGKYYAEVKATTIPAHASGKSYSALTFNPVEVTRDQLVTMLKSLKDY
ncbi:MAG: hypothetical protein JWN78_426 [Bacteroidota bacterium]|nr:hypothetical protein [Bacteroidota bacterium]